MKHEQNYWTIYCHIHRESGRRYVGLTKKTWRKRWNQHVYTSGKSVKNGISHFANAIRKYGKEAFDHEVLEISNSLEEANAREQYWIEFYDTRNPVKGFNLALGGHYSSHPIKNPWDRPEYRAKCTGRVLSLKQRAAISSRMTGQEKSSDVKKKISASLRGRTLSDETKKKISESGKGKILDLETRSKISESNTGKRHSEESKLRMSVIQKEKAATPESKAKRSLVTKGRVLSQKTRANLSLKNSGKKLSLETRKKISESLKRLFIY